MRKILIIQTASIGDVILSTPVLEKLHNNFPDSKIDFLLRKGTESLFENHPFLNDLIIWDKSKNKYRNLFHIIKKLRSDKYDFLINIQRFASTGLITALSGAKTTIGFDKNPFSFLFTKSIKHIIGNVNEYKHEIDRNLELIKDITDDKPASIKLYPCEKDFDRVKKYKSSEYICIAPCSLWFTKQYPADKWVEFINDVNKKYTIYLLGSKKDYRVCQNIINKANYKKIINLAGDLSLLETAALMKDAKMNFVNDSAPQHLGSAVNAPLTTIFCSTIPAFGFGPLSDDSVTIETCENLKCRPCGLHGHNFCKEKHFKCAYTIKKEQLLKRI